MTWRPLLSELIQTGTFRTQRELARVVETRSGRRIDQASISRELQALGVRKVDGFYRLGHERDITSHIRRTTHTAAGCMFVVQTDLAFASVVAQTIDEAGLPGVLGTIAGDDTVFVAVSGPTAHPGILAVLGLEDRRTP
jgi:transcriptional regulator of arginine metabolism